MRGRSPLEVDMAILKAIGGSSRLATIESKSCVNNLTLKSRLVRFEKVGLVKSESVPFVHQKLTNRLEFRVYSLTGMGYKCIKAWDCVLNFYSE